MDKPIARRYNGSKGVIAVAKIDAQLGVRVTNDLKTRLTKQARSEKRSVSALVVDVVEAYLESKGSGKQD